jgi:hypothetical protein
MRSNIFCRCALAFLLSVLPLQAQTDRETENLAAFARIYGYVRFFHPSDQAVSINWDKFAMLGAQIVRSAADEDSLRAALVRLFRPIAPTIQVTKSRASVSTADSSAFPLLDAQDDASQCSRLKMTYWHYLGVRLSEQSNVYRQQRVISAKRPRITRVLRVGESYASEIWPQWSLLTAQISPGVALALPLALPVNAEGKTPSEQWQEFNNLKREITSIDLNAIDPTDWRLRIAGVVTAWNVFQHFHPYLDGIGVKWDDALQPALLRALRDKNADDYYATLSELVAKTQDGHGFVYGRPKGMGGIPIRVAVIQDRLVITGAGAPFRKGDVIERIDGVSAMKVLHDRERYASGSPHLRQFRALNQFGEGRVGSIAKLDILRDGIEQTVEFTRTVDRRGYFFNPIGEFEFPPFAEVRPGIFYVNIPSLDKTAFNEKMPLLSHARGIIFDWRWDGRASSVTQSQRLQPHADIIPHLIDKTIQASPMRIPEIMLPDRIGWTYNERSWTVQPRTPKFMGRIVFIDDPSVVSYGETCMAMIADYHLATLVGAPTAGCNGNANFIPLPGGFRVMWTGMDVRKHDGSPFYTIGFVPDFPVVRTIRAAKDGRDEYLEKAIEVIEGMNDSNKKK